MNHHHFAEGYLVWHQHKMGDLLQRLVSCGGGSLFPSFFIEGNVIATICH